MTAGHVTADSEFTVDGGHPDAPEAQLSRAVWIANFITIVLPFAGLIAAAWLFWGWGFSWVELSLLLGMYVVTGLGITVGYHRLFTHRAFQTVRPIKFLLGVMGSMAVQGPIVEWVAVHRRHHQHSDEAGDPHSPHLHGEGIRGLFKGLFHAHMGWLFRANLPDVTKYARDLLQDGMIRKVNALFPAWVFVGLLIPAIIGGLWTLSWTGALLGFIWGGLVRVFLIHHVTWSINSVCHLWGTQPFDGGDESRNNPVFGILAWGEGWHNNHHAFPTSAKHGLRWWEIDLSYLVIRFLAVMRLAWNVRVPSTDAIRLKRNRR